MLIQPHLAIFLERFLRVRTNPLIHVLIFLSDTFIHGLSFVWLTQTRVAGTVPVMAMTTVTTIGWVEPKLTSCLSVIRDLIEQGPRRRRRGAPPTPVWLSGSMSRGQIQVSWLENLPSNSLITLHFLCFQYLFQHLLQNLSWYVQGRAKGSPQIW